MKVDSKGLGLSETVEVLILNNTSIKYSFPDNQTNLDNALIHAVSIHTDLLTHSLKGKPLLPTVEARKGFLTLSDNKNKDYNALLPLVAFLVNSMHIFYIKPRMFNIRNSFIELPQINTYGGIPAGGMIILITFFYNQFDPAKQVLNSIGELESENY